MFETESPVESAITVIGSVPSATSAPMISDGFFPFMESSILLRMWV